MNPETTLFRQVHPSFLSDGKLTSQAFMLFPKDNGKLSVYDGDKISAADSFNHYIKQENRDGNKLKSEGVWGVNCAEVDETGLTSQPDPLPESPAHALVSFGTKTDKESKRLAKQLTTFALERGRLYPPS